MFTETETAAPTPSNPDYAEELRQQINSEKRRLAEQAAAYSSQQAQDEALPPRNRKPPTRLSDYR